MTFLSRIKQKFITRKYRDASDFFVNATPKEQVALLKTVVRQANEDQRDLMRKYSKLKPNNT